MVEQFPVILILFDAAARRAYWVHVQDYFRERARRPRGGAKTVRILLDRRRAVNQKAIQQIRSLKVRVATRLAEVPPDA
jgi:hypothetical protein